MARRAGRGLLFWRLPLLLLGLAQLRLTATTEEDAMQLSDPESCRPDEYRFAGRCCQLCPAGEYVGKPCVSPHTQGKCVKCDEQTFTAFPNGLDACLPCSVCRDEEEMVAECSSVSNRKCQCRAGHFYHPGSLELCNPCSKCPKGQVTLQKCNATADTVCGLAGPSTTVNTMCNSTGCDVTKDIRKDTTVWLSLTGSFVVLLCPLILVCIVRAVEFWTNRHFYNGDLEERENMI
ncbi:tumor necrosis factor receptor superfamily member 23 [Tupaia chinensis]|uniref:tumor necrosis factor receptor superfamily member 23 n=1 Tax=Tupaia chinensis TaxID=246437 RepID=UPI0003C8D9EC|nr:tumor necrosis factor receptor superfamily member 23 [Tupaia chinensis]